MKPRRETLSVKAMSEEKLLELRLRCLAAKHKAERQPESQEP